ncbi:MAG: GTP-binding protein HflX, partial [Planctomycetota bacterium]
TQLVASFRATLEEVLDADLIIHVRDISHAETENQAKDVADILSAMGIETENNNKILEAWNKVDLLSVEDRAAIEELTTRDPMKIPFSALTGQGIDKLSEAIDVSLAEPRIGQKIVLAYSQGKERAWLFELGLVEDEVVDDDGYELLVNWTKKQAGQFMDEFQSDTGKLPSSR